METQETGASTEEAGNGDSSTDTTEESTATGETSEDGTQVEDADTLKERLAEKDKHITKLEKELRDNKSKKAKSDVSEDQDDVMTWMTINTDGLKLVAKEFQEELAFYKSHKIPITNDIRDRALRDARARKGVGSKSSEGAERQTSTSTEVTGEIRKSQKGANEVPPEIKALYPDMTPERYLKYKAEFDAKKKRG